MAVWIIIYIVVIVVVLAGMWMAFEKTGAPGWGAIIPIYNLYLLTKMGEKPAWWIILFFIPIVNIVIAILLMIEVAKGFGQSTGFGVGMALLPFIVWPIVGFGDAQWQKEPIAV